MSEKALLDRTHLARRLSGWLGTHEDTDAWIHWLTVNEKRRSWNELRKVLQMPVREAIKIRALAAMLCWSSDQDPFDGRIKTEFYESFRHFDHSDLERLSPELATVAAIIVTFCLDAIDAGAKTKERYRDLYNSYIPALLSRIPEHQSNIAEELFERFRLLDDCPLGTGFEEVSGHNVFDRTLFVSGLSDECKLKIDRRMRQLVDDEFEGKTKARAEHEFPDRWYIHNLIMDLFGSPHRSLDHFEQQVFYVAAWPTWSPEVLREARFGLLRMCERLQERSGPGSACHLFVRRAVMEGFGEASFKLHKMEEVAFAKRWLEVYEKDDDLVETLHRVLRDARRIEAETLEAQAQKTRELQAFTALC